MVKKWLVLPLLLIALGAPTTGCSCSIWKDAKEDYISEKEFDKEGIPKNPFVKKWYLFEKKIKNIAEDFFSVATDILATTMILEDKEIEEKIKNQKDDEPTGYWRNDQKIRNYQNLQEEYKKLPLISEQKYEKEIKSIFKTMEFWITYNHFAKGVKGHFFKLFNQIFDIASPWKENKKRITTVNIKINRLFNIDWEYKTRIIDPDDSEKWIETYNQQTQIKLFEYIQFNKYVEKLYDKYAQEDGIDYRNANYFEELSEYEEYIDIKQYEEWVQKNKIKAGFGVWKEIG